MNDLLDVYLYGRRVAEIERRSGQSYRLRYLDEWAESSDAMPISLSLPLPQRSYSGQVLLSFLDNLLPDSGDVRNRWAREAGLNTAEPFYLLGEYGTDVVGALQFSYAGATPNSESSRTLASEQYIAERIRELEDDHTSWRGSHGDSGHFSLGGAQGKFALGRSSEGWYEPSGNFPATHIFKPRVRGLPDGEITEHLTMQLARLSQMNVAATRLEQFEGEHSLIVERFDRVTLEEGVVRLHQEDLAQALGVSPLKKYEMHGGPGYTQILKLLKQHSSLEEYGASASGFVRSLIFSWMLLNTDAHAKNYSIFIRGDGADLTPLYDANSLIPYLGCKDEVWDDRRLRQAFDRTKLSMRIAVDYEAGEQDWFSWQGVARDAGIDRVLLQQWAIETAELMPSRLAALAAQLPAHLQTDTVARFVERMPIRSAQVLAAINSGVSPR